MTVTVTLRTNSSIIIEKLTLVKILTSDGVLNEYSDLTGVPIFSGVTYVFKGADQTATVKGDDILYLQSYR